jgi:cytochrome c553
MTEGDNAGIPPIVGRDEASIVEALTAYKAGRRDSQIMVAVTLALSDEEIATVARYLAAQEAQP